MQIYPENESVLSIVVFHKLVVRSHAFPQKFLN